MTSQFIQEKNLISMVILLQASLRNLINKNNPLSNLLVKINHFGHRELSASKVLLN